MPDKNNSFFKNSLQLPLCNWSKLGVIGYGFFSTIVFWFLEHNTYTDDMLNIFERTTQK